MQNVGPPANLAPVKPLLVTALLTQATQSIEQVAAIGPRSTPNPS